MGNGKNKPQTVNNINQLNLEIDYDKLAEAIVKAQERAKDKTSDSSKDGKTKFFPAIWRILKGEKSEDGRFLSAPFAVIISCLYRFIAILGLIAAVLLGVATVMAIGKVSWQGWNILSNVLAIIFVIAVTMTVFLYMLMFWGAANDVKHEKDKNYVISVFSGLVSVAALIVAIIALYKGVG